MGFEVGFLAGANLFGLPRKIADAIERLLQSQLKAWLAGQGAKHLLPALDAIVERLE
jgi:hypothetical protein